MLSKGLAKGLAAAAVLAVAPVAALADHPGSHVRILAGNVAEVDVIFAAPDTCHRIVQAEAGAPEGVNPAADAVPATVTVSKDTEGAPGSAACEESMTPLESTFALSIQEGIEVVEIYFIDRDGEVLETERVEVSEAQ